VLSVAICIKIYAEGKRMKVIFRSKDFASVTGTGLGFTNRRPMASSWHFQGRVQHRDWQGTYECSWEGANSTGMAGQRTPAELVWIVRGDARLFGLAAALKARNFLVDVEKDDEIVPFSHDK
jgi:hypothetical protein